MTDESPKRPLILFSGGADSTYVLYQALVVDGVSVDTLYIDGNQGIIKQIAETKARVAIMAKLLAMAKEAHPDKEVTIVKDHYISAADLGKGPQPGITYYAQGLSWFLGALYTFDASVHSEVRIAYTREDGLHEPAEGLKHAWGWLTQTQVIKVNDGIKFPVIGLSKASILKELPAEVLVLTWTCELPRRSLDGHIVPCHRCSACRWREVELDLQDELSLLFDDYVALNREYLADPHCIKDTFVAPGTAPLADVIKPKSSRWLTYKRQRHHIHPRIKRRVHH